MFRLLSRAIGLWLLAGAFVAAVIDGMKSIAASGVVVTSAFAAWSELAPASLGALRGIVEARLGAAAWSALTTGLTLAPTWAALGVVGVVFLMLGRPRVTPVGVVP